MSYTRCKATQMGAGKAGLATVGYQLLDSDLTPNGSRVTAGVAEAVAGTGIYSAVVTFPDAFAGYIAWDTGEATPSYALEEINPEDGYLDLANSGETGETLRALFRICRAALVGKATEAGGTVAFKRRDGSTTAVTVVHDATGNRTAVTPGTLT